MLQRHYYWRLVPGNSAGKEFACNAGDPGSIPGLGRSPGEGKGYPLQYSGLENSKDSMGLQRVGHDWGTFLSLSKQGWKIKPNSAAPNDSYTGGSVLAVRRAWKASYAMAEMIPEVEHYPSFPSLFSTLRGWAPERRETRFSVGVTQCLCLETLVTVGLLISADG